MIQELGLCCCGRCLPSRCSACWYGAGTDDLRLYAWVQCFPFLAMLLLFLACPPKYTGTNYWVVAAVVYATAKVFEHFDSAIYSVGFIVSGHTLKHLVAAAACLVILRHFQVRRPITCSETRVTGHY